MGHLMSRCLINELQLLGVEQIGEVITADDLYLCLVINSLVHGAS